MINNNPAFATSMIFYTLAVEALGPICVNGVQFLSMLGNRLSATLFHFISIAIQRCNAICVLGTFPAISVTDGMTCWVMLQMPIWIDVASPVLCIIICTVHLWNINTIINT